MSFIGKAFEIIVVDDNSGDGIDEEVARLSEEGYPVRIIISTLKEVQFSSYSWFHEAIGDILICMDADLSHRPRRYL